MTFFDGLLHIDTLVLADQTCVNTRCRGPARGEIEKESKNSLLLVWLNDYHEGLLSLITWNYINTFIFVKSLNTKGAENKTVTSVFTWEWILF